MSKTAKIFKFVGLSIAIVIYIVILLACILAITMKVYIDKNGLGIDNIEITYTSKMFESDGTERYPLEIVYYKNEDGTGVEAFEFCINSFSDYQFGALKGQGCQFVNENKIEGGLSNIKKWLRYDYTRQSSLSWVSMSEQELASGADGSQFYFDIDGQAYQFRLEGVSGVSYIQNSGATASKVIDNFVNPITAIKNIAGLFTGQNIFSDDRWVSYDTITHYFSLDDFYYEIANSLTVSNVGEGEYSMSLVEMTKYFNIYKVSENGTVSKTNSNADFKDIYFDVNVKVFSDGLKYSDDSVFGIIAEDSDWTLTDIPQDIKDYSLCSEVITLYANSFDFYDYKDVNAVGITLKDSVSNEIKNKKIYSVNIFLDFTSDYLVAVCDRDLILLDNFMKEIEVNSLIIKFDKRRTIYAYENLSIYNFQNVSNAIVRYLNRG